MIDLNELKEGKDGLEIKEWFATEFENSLVDLNKIPERPKPVVSIGEIRIGSKSYPNGIMTQGEMSAISAPSKSYKTYLKSHLAASFLRSHYDDYLNDIRGHRENDECLIDLDTEQGKYWSWNTFNRTKILTGKLQQNSYYPFKLRHLNPLDRVKFIDKVVNSNLIKGKPKLIFIDGVADLIQDSNDLVMSNEISERIMTWTDVYGIHVCVIIHNAFNTTKPTGHLGSAIIKKAETVISLKPEIEKDMNGNEKKTGIVEANHLYSRGKPFESFKFRKHDKEDRLELVNFGEENDHEF